MTEPTSTDPARKLQHRIKATYDEVRNFVSKSGNEGLLNQWKGWDERFKAIFEQSKKRPEVAISFVGGTGAGKSTLLNALIGARVLPVSSMRACTAAVCEVVYRDGPYKARIEFVSRESWEKEIALIHAELRDSEELADEDRDSDEPRQMSRAVRDKLWSVYKPEGSKDPNTFDPFRLVEPQEVKFALDHGATEVESDDIDEFRKFVSKFLDSKDRFWPIVKHVSIQGKFAPLRDGAKIVDLPGINDPNEAREQVTKEHLKSCRFVWLVFNIKRALTRDTITLMQSEEFLRQIVMDGRADALTFVGTAADDIEIESGIDEFGLPEDAEFGDVVNARNYAARDVVRAQLDDLAHQLGRLAGEHNTTADKLAARLKSSEIFTVSAREYLRIIGLAKTNSAGFKSAEETEIPQLLSHMRRTCEGYGVTAHCKSLERQLDTLIQEIKRYVQSRQAQFKAIAETSQQGRKELGAAVKTARDFLDRDLEGATERLEQALDADQALLSERVKRAVDRARADLLLTVQRWQRMAANTLKATCRRGGVYQGTTGMNDLPSDLCKPILDGIAFAWSDFFGDKLTQTLEQGTTRLLKYASSHRNQLIGVLRNSTEISESVTTSIDRILDTTEKVLTEQLAQIKSTMTASIEEKQRRLYESVPEQVRANMQAAFEAAAEEKGAGMKQRIVQILSTHAQQVAQVMFDDARETLTGGVRGLAIGLGKQYREMAETVARNAELAGSSLMNESEQATTATFANEDAILLGLCQIVANHLRCTSEETKQ